MTRRDRVEQSIGELVIAAPFVALCAYLGLLVPCILGMIGLLVDKMCYPCKPHFKHDWQCLVATHGLFTALCLMYAGLQRISPLMGNQPMFVLLCCIGVSWSATEVMTIAIKAGQYDAIMAFDIDTCDEVALRERCRLCGYQGDEIDEIIIIFKSGIPLKEIAARLGVEYQSVRNKKTRYRKVLEM